MKFTVERDTWFRGKSGANSRLLTDDGKRCCLGFFANACGIPDKHIEDITGPFSVKYPHPKPFKFLTTNYSNTDLCCEIMIMNDNDKCGDKYRERKLKELFKQAGHEVEFV